MFKGTICSGMKYHHLNSIFKIRDSKIALPRMTCQFLLLSKMMMTLMAKQIMRKNRMDLINMDRTFVGTKVAITLITILSYLRE